MMKKMTAALAALLLAGVLSACAPSPQPAPSPEAASAPPTTSAPSDAEPSTPELPPRKLEPEQVETEPFDAQTVLDEPLTLAEDLEEVVSYTIRVPQVTLDSSDAAQRINEGFSDLADSFVRYAQEAVYPTAQEKQTIGFLEGEYSLTMEDGQLVVEYTLTERYAGEDAAVQDTRTYRFDTTTGERLADE